MQLSAFLVVDDEPSIVTSLRRELRSGFGRGYRIETALSAEEGLELIEELSGEGVELILVISDWLMPGMKGDEFLALVKRGHPKVVTIMITGHAEGEAIARARRDAGLAACFFKPWRSEELEAAIRQALPSAS